jgi:hypothetical protein
MKICSKAGEILRRRSTEAMFKKDMNNYAEEQNGEAEQSLQRLILSAESRNMRYSEFIRRESLVRTFTEVVENDGDALVVR